MPMDAAKIVTSFLQILVLLLLFHPSTCTSSYHFKNEDEGLDAGGCGNHPSFRDGDVAAGHLYRGASFCDILEKFTSPYDYALLPLVPNWNCNSTDDEQCSQPGPFDAGGQAAAMAFSRAAVTVQGLQCETARAAGGTVPAARVLAVFRFVPPWEEDESATAAGKRAGLGGGGVTTLSAEGAWTASTGRLCMAACLGATAGEDHEACRYRVALDVPTAFSVTRRSIIVGEITAVDGSHPPLSFQQRLSARQDWHQFGRSGEVVPMAYLHTKVVRRRRSSLLRDNFIKRSLLSYPKIAGAADDDLVSLSNLAGDIGLLG